MSETTSNLVATMRRNLGATIAQVLGYTEVLQEQAEELGRETFLPDLQRIYQAGKNLADLVAELVTPSATQLDEVDFPRLRFEIRSSLNHTIGYVEMLQERAYELDQRGFLPDLDKAHGTCRQLLAQLEAAAQPSDAEPGLTNGAPTEPEMAVAGETARGLGTLLVVDDNIQNRDLLGRHLRSLGYRVVHAGSGPAAMERIRADTFDLILLDVVMPGMGGYEVLQWLKADALLRDIPVVMISAMNDTDNVVRCLVIGADDYISKPFDPILLKVRVGSCLERSRWRKLEEFYLHQIQEERARSERVLLNILPKSTVCPS